MDDLEVLALESVSTRDKLRKRLLETKQLLLEENKRIFSKNKIDFDRKCMISDEGQYELCWQLREFPQEPISYRNQQTSVGTVFFRRKRGD